MYTPDFASSVQLCKKTFQDNCFVKNKSSFMDFFLLKKIPFKGPFWLKNISSTIFPKTYQLSASMHVIMLFTVVSSLVYHHMSHHYNYTDISQNVVLLHADVWHLKAFICFQNWLRSNSDNVIQSESIQSGSNWIDSQMALHSILRTGPVVCLISFELLFHNQLCVNELFSKNLICVIGILSCLYNECHVW